MTVLGLASVIEIETADFIEWNRTFHSRPCQAFYSAIVCGHDASYRARATCDGCEESDPNAYLCLDHMRAYESGMMVYHFYPCGLMGFRLTLSTITPVTLH